MAAPYRILRPAPLVEGQQQPSPRQSQPRERNRAALACQPCRKKRRKCSGERPECGECARRELRCVYEAAPGQTRMASLREGNERMKTDLDTMMELYWYLQTQPKEEVGEALSAIRTGASPSEVIGFIKNYGSSTDATPSSSSTIEAHTLNDSRPTLDRGVVNSSSQSSQSISAGSNHETQAFTAFSHIQSPTGINLTQSSPSRIIESLSKGAQAFFTGINCIFYIYDPDEAERMLNDLRPHLENARKSWLELVFQGSIPSHLKPSLCSLCIMAAVGLQYTENPIPALDFEPSSSDGSYGFVSVFYESARHLLEAVIEVDTLEAMKVCAALTIFNVNSHATIAMAYANMGINFVLSLGPSFGSRSNSPSENSWTKHKRAARTIVTLHSWLVATLGYVHNENTELQSCIHWFKDEKDLTPHETIQQELNKVVQIEANLLHNIDSPRNISPALLGSTRRDLAQWHQQLPTWMHLSALVEPSGIAVILRRTLYLVHLFYLSGILLLARLAHDAQNISTVEGMALVPRYDIEQLRSAARDGVQAARTVARILQLQMDEKAIFQRCWNCEFSAYMSCLTLLHSTAQMQLHDYPRPTWQKELSYAQSCLDVLEYCAKADKVADRFAGITRGYYATLTAQVQSNDDIRVFQALENSNYLFSVPSKSPAHLAEASRDLLKLVRCPFDSPSSVNDVGTLKASLGAHVTLPFNHSPPRDANSWSAISTALSGMSTGHFVGSSQPHGWDVFLNLDTI